MLSCSMRYIACFCLDTDKERQTPIHILSCAGRWVVDSRPVMASMAAMALQKTLAEVRPTPEEELKVVEVEKEPWGHFWGCVLVISCLNHAYADLGVTFYT